MSLHFCSREEELAALVREGRWPHACDPELRAHVALCGPCGDLVLVAQTLHQARAATVQPAHLASPGTLWWRARLRRSYEDFERMNKPIFLAERLGFLCMLAAALGLAAWQWKQIAAWTYSLADDPHSGALALLIAAAGTLVLVGGFAISLLTEKE
jgi:hypothetical protein